MMATLKFTYFFNSRNILLKIIAEVLQLTTCLFRMAVKKNLVPTKPATISLLKFKPCVASLRIMLICIRSYLISVLREKYLILDTYH